MSDAGNGRLDRCVNRWQQVNLQVKTLHVDKTKQIKWSITIEPDNYRSRTRSIGFVLVTLLGTLTTKTCIYTLLAWLETNRLLKILFPTYHFSLLTKIEYFEGSNSNYQPIKIHLWKCQYSIEYNRS